jgi:geranylgeranyl diphosphate synthase type II
MLSVDFDTRLGSTAKRVDEILREVIGRQSGLNPDLLEAMEYTLFAPGKRIRGALVLWSCELVKGPASPKTASRGGQINRDADIAAAAVEMVHTYSLVHDDLPAMDDDDMRRGRASCHKAFDEATAILTGDALLTLAFEILAKEIDDSEIARKLIVQLGKSAGAGGMIAGQMADVAAEKTEGTIEALQYIHTNKTAKMFQCAVLCGGIAGRAETSELRRLSEYGLNLGLAFQVADDILDVCGNSEDIGKTTGKDAQAAKCTYPAVVGLEKSRQVERQLADKAVAALESFGPQADILRQLPIALLERGK